MADKKDKRSKKKSTVMHNVQAIDTRQNIVLRVTNEKPVKVDMTLDELAEKFMKTNNVDKKKNNP